MNIREANRNADNISKWMRSYAHAANAGGYIVGLSGGVDSSVVAALAVKAVGVESVHGVIMPLGNEPDDELDAKLVADELGISYDIVNMKGALDAMAGSFFALPDEYEVQNERLMLANIKARLRMIMLYQFAGEFKYLVAGTGNRSEDAVGYFTKYGDGGVDILPLAQFYKSEVRQLAISLGLPENIANRTSTAGLWEGQLDETELGLPYDVLDNVLMFLDGYKESLDIPKKYNIGKVLNLVVSMMNKNRHKANYPPIYSRI